MNSSVHEPRMLQSCRQFNENFVFDHKSLGEIPFLTFNKWLYIQTAWLAHISHSVESAVSDQWMAAWSITVLDILMMIQTPCSACPFWWWLPAPEHQLVCSFDTIHLQNSWGAKLGLPSDWYLDTVVMQLSLAFTSNCSIASIVVLLEKKLWNWMSKNPVAASTKIQPPLYDFDGFDMCALFCLFQIPWPLNFLPLVEHSKWPSTTWFPGCSFSADKIPDCVWTTWVCFPGTNSRFVFWIDTRSTFRHIMTWNICCCCCCCCCMVWDVAWAPVHIINWTVYNLIPPKQQCHQRRSLFGLDVLKVEACIVVTFLEKFIASCLAKTLCSMTSVIGKLIFGLIKILIACWSGLLGSGWTVHDLGLNMTALLGWCLQKTDILSICWHALGA